VPQGWVNGLPNTSDGGRTIFIQKKVRFLCSNIPQTHAPRLHCEFYRVKDIP